MKKVAVSIIIFLFLFNHSSHSQQSLFYLTKYLRDQYSSITKTIPLDDDVKKALNESVYKDVVLTKELLNTNPFFSNPNLFENAAGAGANPFASNAIAGLGNINVSNFADGLAKFLVERSKEELNVAFFRKFQCFLKKYPEVKIVFPTTIGIINNIAAYNYSAMLPALRASFQKDLNAFSGNLINLRETSSYDGYATDNAIKGRADEISNFLNNTIAGRSIIAALLVTNGVVKGNTAADIINTVASDKVCVTNDNFSNAVLFVNLISQSLRSTDQGRVWITHEQINELVKDDIEFKIFFGLLYASNANSGRPIQFNFGANSVTLQAFLKGLSDNWLVNEASKFKSSFISAANAASDVSDNSKNINDIKKQGDQSSILQYADYASSISIFLKSALSLLPNNPVRNPELSALLQDVSKFLSVIDDATNSCYDIKSQNYGALVLHTSTLLGGLLNNSNYSFKDDYIKYGTFMASIVQAKNSDEVKAAIEAAVLPVGSSSVKRESIVNISINSYIGPFYGWEKMPTLKQNQTSNNFSLTAPVGVAFTLGNIKFSKSSTEDGKSVSLFISLIDVGALASFRLQDDSTNVTSEVQLKNILAPGAFLYFGFGKCPISLGFGAQLGPQLRNVTATDINVDKNYYIRYGFSLVVDIPFFNLYTKSK